MTRSRMYIATPPGFTIKEQLADRGMSQKEFAARMGLSEKHVTQLLKGDVGLTPETACKLEMVLGIPSLFWINLEGVYQDKRQKAEEENCIEADIALAKEFPYAQMAKQGWVADARTWDERVVQLRQFFEVARLGYLSKDELVPCIACRRDRATEAADFALIAWAQEAKRLARDAQTAKVDPAKLSGLLPEIKVMSREDPSAFSDRLAGLLAGCGIALVYLPHIDGSFLNGATFRDGSKIVLGVTVRGRTSDKFWFSLFHELGHVVCGHVGKPEGTCEEDELEADAFAAEALIPESALRAFADGGRLTSESIRAFACEAGVDPGIVVGRLQKEGVLGYNQFNGLKTKYMMAS